ncbi:uncharacterized protein GLRG_02629 [Colletotrichum graminicola M1.001]|uniref:Uncharacterized protein n=1 Tax=Colletotrichum graminicola (strain M1.001 / M2 / FGSC 10212) TaxID=645133 RepID=E3Q7H1_COLGM|nr:uncharacterized protein GLRG_02629 [Colletotrichum graminicola M1.001]EFQ26809.1 hypothetical protein GLRG_02629 [Colletotrichum graminicola M1.001]
MAPKKSADWKALFEDKGTKNKPKIQKRWIRFAGGLKTLIIAKLNARVTALTLNPTNFSDYRKVKKALTVGREIDYADAWSVVFRICCDKR